MVREATKGIAAMTEHSGSEEAGGAISAAGEEVIRGLLATLREDMKKEESGGDEVLALDPLVVESQLLSYQHSAASFVGLSEFIIEDVCVNVQTLAVTINLRYDSLLLDGEYDISGKLVKVIPLSTRGPFTVTASNARITLWVKLKTCRGRLEVGQLRSELVVGDVHLDLSHMTGGSLVSKYVSSHLANQIRTHWQQHEPELSMVLKKHLNDELKNVSLMSLQLLQSTDKYMRRGSLY
ncbi:hypothetical protein E2C01_045609 [Portunus trituberculatus]|uniref:Lipid-binding serum glycoprotein N-terminal domain-containing protein n=1 Tax=Portunus trituberculatus TaxID=210409 RepID=A0A5B7G1N2_PORTR|nr:hypothetical protein [Portunus trituberculatus]